MKALRLENYRNRVQSSKAYNEVKSWWNIGCIRYPTIFIFVLLLWSLLLHQYQRWQREWLFCKVIQPGMSSTEVLEILDQQGEFGINQYKQDDDTVLYVTFFESWGTEMRYGVSDLQLDFRNGVLAPIIVKNHFGEYIRNLCE